eukprot:scaffold1732_cov117-Isochrysis_galbana.AAC.5
MRLTIAWGAPSAGVAKRMRMAWCLRAAGVRGNMKGSSNALSELLMRINSLRITLHSPMCGEFSLLSPHMRQRVPYWGVSPLSRVVRARWMMCLKWVCTSRGVRKVVVQREAASSHAWSFMFSLACQAAWAGGDYPDTVWRYTLKRFVDLALALAHDARTKRLLAISRGEPPPSLNTYQPRLSPLATLDKEAELLFSDTLHDHLTEYDLLAQYTVNSQQTTTKPHNPKPKPNASANDTPNGSQKRDQLKKDTGAIAPWGHSGSLKEGTSPEGKGR